MISAQSRAVSKFQTKSIQESSWIQLLLTKFWLDDVSPKFEKQISILKSQ
jgi:hypothetical protein